MRNLTKKEAKELLDFFLQLDFKRVDKNTVQIVENRFYLDELPEFVKYHIELYLEALEIIN